MAKPYGCFHQTKLIASIDGRKQEGSQSGLRTTVLCHSWNKADFRLSYRKYTTLYPRGTWLAEYKIIQAIY